MAVIINSKTPSMNSFIEFVEGQDIYGTDFTGIKAFKNSDIFTGVNIIASDIAQSSFKPLDNVDLNSNVLQLLNRQPNETQSHYLFMYALIVNLVLTGNAYALIHRDGEEVTSLEFVQTQNVNVIQDIKDGTWRYEVTMPYGSIMYKAKPKDILHFRVSTVDGFLGRSPLLSLQSEVAMQTNGLNILNKFFAKGIFNGGQLKLKNSALNNDAKKQIRQDFESVNGNGGIMVLDDTQEFTDNPVNTDVLKLIQGNQFSTKQIAKVLGIPLNRFGMELVNSADSVQNDLYIASTLSTYEQAICDEILMKLGLELELDLSKLVNDTVEDRLKNILSGKTKSEVEKVIKINEARTYLGLTELSEGDRLLGELENKSTEVIKSDNSEEVIENDEQG